MKTPSQSNLRKANTKRTNPPNFDHLCAQVKNLGTVYGIAVATQLEEGT
jgi:hypothetical protein